MCRPVASDVSALSSGVANSNQTMQHVSSSLSKIPYGGFSPVRLQTGSPRRPSPTGNTHLDLYAAQVWPSDPMAIAGMLAGRLSPHAPVQRPLARQRVMLSRRVIAYYGLIRDSGLLPLTYYLIQRVSVAQLLPTGRPEVPQFTLRVCTHVPHSVPRRTARLLVTVTSSRILAFAIFVVARRPLVHKIRFIVVCVTRLQVSLYATARWVCSPCPGQDFYFRAFIPQDRSSETSSITTWATVNSHDRSCTG